MTSTIDIEAIYTKICERLAKNDARGSIDHNECRTFILQISKVAEKMSPEMSAREEAQLFKKSIEVLTYLQTKAAGEQGLIGLMKQSYIVLIFLSKVYNIALALPDNQMLTAEVAAFAFQTVTGESSIASVEKDIKKIEITKALSTPITEHEKAIMQSDAFKYTMISIFSIFAANGYISEDPSKWTLPSKAFEDSDFVKIFNQSHNSLSTIHDQYFTIGIENVFSETVKIEVQIVNSFTMKTFGIVIYSAIPHIMIAGLVAAVVYVAVTNPTHTKAAAEGVLPVLTFIAKQYLK